MKVPEVLAEMELAEGMEDQDFNCEYFSSSRYKFKYDIKKIYQVGPEGQKINMG